ncbi:MAG: hypothetical protein NZ772_16680, partial [Cyanobacteria bacterium]|nr:hypothetical protein [Cyanobacteriota bacterium]MDW8202804.1 hypothetical protein [Cyanobacteriota bacterium SKYGB_h_bin112]
LLMEALGVQVQVPEHFDTDRFGTFTRDIDRPGDQIETARLKAKAAMEITGETLAIASEGSFVPHPWLPGLPINREVVVLLDAQHDLEIVGQVTSTNTNFRHETVHSLAEAIAFAKAIGFPHHGLVAMTQRSTKDPSHIIKGITDYDHLQAAVEQLAQQTSDGSVHLETDMRAHMNPTRMKVIAEATQDLLFNLQQSCPQCGAPGFTGRDRQPGLPCALCQSPTTLTLAIVYHCRRCGYSQEKLYPDGQYTADPTYCSYCNP